MKLSELLAFVDDPSTCEITYKGRKVKYLNEACRVDEDSRFFIAGHEFGATHLIHVQCYRGDGLSTAWGVWIDESPTIPEEELSEAYGIDGQSFLDKACDETRASGVTTWDWDLIHKRAREMLTAADEAARNEEGEYPDLIEGYEHQSNTSGTGIVNVGHYAWMNEADPDDIDDIEITPKQAKEE